MSEGGDTRVTEVVDHLFRHEAGRMVAALVRLFGLHNLDLAEDVVQETLCRALESWKYGELPANPSAWLQRAARNRAIDVLRRERTFRRFAPDLGRVLDTEWTLVPTVDAHFDEPEIRDSLLRMMFSCCHPRLPAPAQVTVILKYLCGFSVAEIAHALLEGEAAVEKRLTRAKATLQRSGLAEIHAERLAAEQEPICAALYLLFSEGYHGSHPELAVREDLCLEAMRLAKSLGEHPATAGPRAHALLGLMCLHAARLPGRVDDRGSLILLAAQDRAKWDRALIRQGLAYLDLSATGDELTPYHVEAAIAAKHCEAERFEDTDWAGIVDLYDVLLRIRPSPIVALNRAIALAQLRGPEAGLAALAEIPDRERALALARNPAEAELLREKIRSCSG